ncbi:MAG: hypothetical protein Q8932_14180, partial [Bacteroidota bacterium]|nr:hypothetical protein [Bacteroidota bacterium]
MKMISFRKYYAVTGLIAIAIFSLSSLENCAQYKKAPADGSEAKGFAGSQNCMRCHAAIYAEHLQSFHHVTSAAANRQTLKGDFDSANKFLFNDHLLIAAEKKQDSFYQTAYSYGVPKISRPFDIVVGSGKRGQTSIYWFGNYLFQLPLTYFAETDEYEHCGLLFDLPDHLRQVIDAVAGVFPALQDQGLEAVFVHRFQGGPDNFGGTHPVALQTADRAGDAAVG